jgi:hypothetical protein
MLNPPEPPREPFAIVQKIREMLAAAGITCETEYREESEMGRMWGGGYPLEVRTKYFDVTMRFRLDPEDFRPEEGKGEEP